MCLDAQHDWLFPKQQQYNKTQMHLHFVAVVFKYLKELIYWGSEVQWSPASYTSSVFLTNHLLSQCRILKTTVTERKVFGNLMRWPELSI